jgi:hypothetical protein
VNRQDALNANWQYFVVEGHGPSMRGGDWPNNCAYRGVDGAKCAIGCIIPDELYHPGIDSLSILGLSDTDVTAIMVSHSPELRPIQEFLEPCGLPFLQELQLVHDNNYKLRGQEFTDAYRHDLILLALMFDLTTPE